MIIKRKKKGFSLLEVLMAMMILSVSLIALYSSYASSVYIVSTTSRLWKVLLHVNNELQRWERSYNSSVSITQELFEEPHPLAGIGYTRTIKDVTPFEGIIVKVREVEYQMSWQEGERRYSYGSRVFIKPN